MKRTISAILLLFVIILSACDNGGDCKIYNTAYYRTLFRSIDAITGDEVPYTFPEPLDIRLVVNGSDSLVINNMTNDTELALPMCYTQECDTLLLEFGTITTDTLFVEHTNIPYFISMDCGTGMYHNITGLRHTKNFIDSAAIIHPFINFDANENIKLYIAE